MKLFDLIVKINTLVIGLAVFTGIMGSPFFFQDSISSTAFLAETEASEPEVAGAFDEIAEPTDIPSPTPTPTPVPVYEPVHISIPSLGIESDITHVGVTPENVMEVPEDYAQVGWFDQSLKPGEFGESAAIMSGHFDRTDGSPAVFYLLETIEVGDEVIVTAENGTRYVFSVTDNFSHPLEAFPTDIVYGPTEGSSLKLITCDGVWHADKRSYSDRLVVTTQLIRIEVQAQASEAT